MAAFLGLLPLAFWRLGAIDVMAMEGIVADGARHMLRTGDLWVPHLHGEIYTFKPPLAYWMAAASVQIFGTGEWSLRFPFAACGVLMALGVFLFVRRRLGDRAGAICGLASLTGQLTVQKLRFAEFDLPLAAGVGLATVFAIADLTSPTSRAWRWQLAYLALAAAFLAKGVPALMFFAPGLLLAAAFTGSWRRVLRWPHLAGCATFAVCVGAWIVGAWTAEGWDAFRQPFSESRDKGLSWDLQALATTFAKPLVLAVAFLPWTLALPQAFRRRFWRRLDPESGAIGRAAAGFVLGGLLTYMAVPASETRYLLPLAAPVGLLCGIAFSRGPVMGATRGMGRLARWTTVAVAGVLGVSLPFLVPLGELEIPMTHALGLAAVALLLAGLVLAMPRWSLRRSSRAVACVTGLALLLALTHIAAIAPHRAHSRSLRHLAADFQAHLDPGEEVWSMPVRPGYRHSSLTYYLHRPIRTVEPDASPPPGSEVLLFSDEARILDFEPAFRHCTLEEHEQRGIEFELVRVAEEGSC